MNTQTNIHYDPRRRQYLLTGEIGEELSAFPAGADGKRAAIVAQLEIESPAALALARRAVASYPVLDGRALRAAQIVAAGGVRDRLQHSWDVDSQNKNELTYTVSSGGYHSWHCTCPDWIRGWQGELNGAPTLKTKGQRQAIVCKHVLAVMFYLDLADDRKWPPPCPICRGEMNIRHRRDNGSGLPFWSCRKFPACRGRRDFTIHPDDAAQARHEMQASALSFERAKAAGLITMGANGHRRRRERELEQARWEMQQRARDQALPAEPKSRGRAKLFKT
jgi:hypothetical protein